MGFFIDFIFILATLYFHSIKLKKNPSKVFACRHGVTAHAHTLEGLPLHPTTRIYQTWFTAFFNKINNRVFSWCIDTNVNSYILTAKRLPFDKLSTFKSTNSFCTSPLGKSTAPRICTLWVGSYSLPFYLYRLLW